ncbi:MAG: hypothetical protein PHT07_20115 [Paludibacter sp.]|nr:hypothetical protein [Paludibacter sp.]
MRLFLLLIFFSFQLNVIGQQKKIYNISFEESERSISFANQAIKCLSNGHGRESLPFIIKAIQSDSTMHKSYELLYKACLLDKEYPDSILQNFYIAKRIHEQDDEICFYLAELYRLKKEFNKSIPEFTNAIELSKKAEEKSILIVQYYSGRAYCYLKTNRISEAIADYSIYLEQKPDDDIILTNRGVCYQKLGKKQLAIADWEKASKLGNTIAKTYFKNITQK